MFCYWNSAINCTISAVYFLFFYVGAMEVYKKIIQLDSRKQLGSHIKVAFASLLLAVT